MSTHINNTVAIIRQLRNIRRSLTRQTLIRLAVNIVLNHVDYCNAILTDLLFAQLSRLEAVVNAAAPLVVSRQWRPRGCAATEARNKASTPRPLADLWEANPAMAAKLFS